MFNERNARKRMIFYLSEQVAWCGADDVCQVRERFGAVICVAENVKVPIGPGSVPYFSLPHNEHQVVTDQYILRLMHIIQFVQAERMLPLLVHCRSGHHRSPTVAALAEAMINNRPIDCVLTQVLDIWRDYEEHRKGVFAQTLMPLAVERLARLQPTDH